MLFWGSGFAVVEVIITVVVVVVWGPVQDVATAFDYSARHLSTLFHTHTGRHLKRAIDETRAAYARKLLAYGDGSITDVSEAMGFPDVYAFSRFFRRLEGVSPSAWREEHVDLPKSLADA